MKNYLFRKSGFALVLSAGMLILSCGSFAEAAEQPGIVLPQTEAEVDLQTGEFSFDIQVASDQAYAGAEFGVICSRDVEITDVTYDISASATGPKAANGLVWFGYFDGEDSFTDTVTVTVRGNCPTDADSAVAIKDVRLYSIGNSEYSTTPLESDLIVNLRIGNSSSDQQTPSYPQETGSEQEPDTSAQSVTAPRTGDDINCILLAGCVVIAAAAACTLIYRKKHSKTIQEEKKNVI